jgi:hypothetical protein
MQGMKNSCPWSGNAAYPVTSSNVVRSATHLDSKNVFTWANSANGRFALQSQLLLPSATFFIVTKPNVSGSQPGWIIGGLSGAMSFSQDSSNGKPALVKATVALIGESSVALSNGTWYQVNATYNGATGDYAFRVAQTSAGSGNNSQSITVATSAIGYNPATNAEDAQGDIAEIIIYDRVLTGPEITAIEGYLNTKWGV